MSSISRHDVLVVGGGLAGLRAAVVAHDAGLDVAVMSKVYPMRSHSGAAQGGVNASLGNHPDGRDDSWELHAFDTVKGSDYLADQPSAEILARDAPERVLEMEHWGAYFSRFEDGRIAQRPFGGAGFPRTCYAADRTGHHLLHTLWPGITGSWQTRETGPTRGVLHSSPAGTASGAATWCGVAPGSAPEMCPQPRASSPPVSGSRATDPPTFCNILPFLNASFRQ